MATNNYFGFTHGGTQYGAAAAAQPATAYAAPTPTAYAVQPTHQTAYAASTERAPTYGYQATATPAGQYAYAARTQAQPTVSYDTTKTYYTPAPAAPAVAQTVYTVAESAYQTTAFSAAKPAAYTTAYSATTQQRTGAVKPASQSNVSGTYSYTATPASAAVTKTGSGYDAALYSAATSYYQQQQNKGATGATGANNWKNKGGFQAKAKAKMPPKQTQLHYCEVCKISCAGPQTYREHLEGQKHKKKELAAKAGTSVPASRSGQRQLRCELCDVTCTGSDAYAAHIRGAKHQKVLKLHTKLGKPIPSTEPTVVASTAAGSTAAAATAAKPSTAAATAATATTASARVIKSATTTVPMTAQGTKKVLATPKITFVGGTQLKTTGVKTEEVKTAEAKAAASATAAAAANATAAEDDDDKDDYLDDKDVTPVGHEYIEEVKTEFGKVVSFHCKLCECKFNDPNAKLMHMKGRRHRLQYKKKVDPSLQVEVKPSIKARKLQEERARRFAIKEEYWRRRDAEERWREEMRMNWEQPYFGDFHGGYGGYGGGPGMHVRRPDTSDDRHVMAKHASIYPNEGELAAVQGIVSSVEKALKLVSDYLSERPEVPKQMETETKPKIVKKPPPKPVKEEPKDGDKAAGGDAEEKEPGAPPRVLKGVMRVGVLAKGLLLHGDLNVHLVVLCSEKPTRTLLDRVADNLPNQLSTVSEDKFEVRRCVEEAAIIVTMEKEPKTTCFITLTSPIMREENLTEGEAAQLAKPDPPDVLDRQKCLDALAALRHAKWFQARANGLQSCVVVIRILRDLCQRVPTWTPLNQWAMELLVEKCVSSGGPAMSPGDALRRVFECISSGILLPGGPGLYDPCEKEVSDAAAGLTNQEREDITASAQHALRLIAFRQIHKVLGMDPLPVPKFTVGKRFNPRKRRRTNSAGEGNDAEGADGGKKDKKEDEEK